MTAIVGIESRGRVWIGGDRCVSDDVSLRALHAPKVWKRPGVAFGGSGDLASLQRVQARAFPRPRTEPARYLVRHVAPAVKAEGGDLTLLVGIGGTLWAVYDDGAVCRVDPEWAIGSGGDAARAALYLTPGGARARVLTALATAAEVCPLSVAPPFDVVST